MDQATVQPLVAAGDAFVCANDRTAGELMHVVLALGYRIPGGYPDRGH